MSAKDETPETDKRVDYLKYINTFGIGVVTLLAGYMSIDIRDIKQAQQVQAVELMRLDTNQKTVFKSMEIMDSKDEKMRTEINDMKVEWVKALQELSDKVKR